VQRNLAVLAVMAVGCGCSKAPDPPRDVRVVASAFLSTAPYYQAAESGAFQQQGIKTEEITMPGSQALPLLASGKLDVGFFAATPALFAAVSKGAKVRLVAARQRFVPNCNTGCVIYGSAKTFPNGIHLTGPKRFTISVLERGSIGEFCLDAHLQHAGVKGDTLDRKGIREPEALAAIRGGQLDMVISAGTVEFRKMNLDFLTKGEPMSAILPNFQYAFMVYGSAMVDDLDRGVRFLRAYAQGAKDYAAGATPKFFTEYVKSNDLDPEKAARFCRAEAAADLAINPADVQRFADWAAKRGYIDPIQADAVIDHRFTKALAAGNSQ
jgi:ABC-type nitrate/sulfonate/bicarbonate transport system substrate-binding protein